MLLVLDSNEYIFAFGLSKKFACERFLDFILSSFPRHQIRLPRLIMEEVGHHLTPEEHKEFVGFVTSLTTVDENFVVPFEVGATYERKGLKPADAFIAAYVEWTGADALVTENRHFLSRTDVPFKVLTAQDCLQLFTSLS